MLLAAGQLVGVVIGAFRETDCGEAYSARARGSAGDWPLGTSVPMTVKGTFLMRMTWPTGLWPLNRLSITVLPSRATREAGRIDLGDELAFLYFVLKSGSRAMMLPET